MEHVVFDITIIAVVSIIGISGIVLGFIWSGLKKNDPNFYKAKEETLKEQVEYFRDEIHRLNGTISKQRQKFQTDGEYNLDDQGDLASLAKSLLPQFVEFLPQNVQTHAKGLLNNPEVVDLLEEIHKRFPKEVKSLFSGFLKGGSPKPLGYQTDKLTSITTYSPGGA